MNTLDFKKANGKHTENRHSINKKPIVVFFFFSLHPYEIIQKNSSLKSWIAMLKGSFGDTCRLALNLNSWFVLERHLTQGRSGHRPHVTSVKVLSRTEEVMKGKKTTKRVALVTFTPPADRVVSISFWLWRTKNRIWRVEERLEISSPHLFTRPRLCSYLTKYTLSLFSSSFTEISIYECL